MRGATPLTLGALFLVTLALRPQVIGVGPLLPQIRDDLGISHGVAGLLSTIPVLCMGLFAPAGPWLARRLGQGDAKSVSRFALAGGAAGIAAAFNTPLAGIVFAIEELAGTFEHRFSGALLTTVMISGVVSLWLVGD